MNFPSRRFWRAAICALLLVFAATSSTRNARAEVIRSFDSTIHLHADSSFDVTETIAMDFENSPRHGIYRIMPVTYRRAGGTYTIYVDVKSVTDENGDAVPYTQTRQGGDLNIKIGNPNRTMIGLHGFRIRYLVRRAINFFAGEPEIYWNVTGDQWPYPIQNATCQLFAPTGVAISKVRAKSFVGPLGSKIEGKVTVKTDSIEYSTTNIQPSDGLTIVARLPKGAISQASTLQTLAWFFADWWALFILPLATAALLFRRWSKSGRDENGGQAVAVEWNPPKDLSPAEVGTLVDERCDMADIVSTLVDLAARGFLHIQETQSTKLLFLSSKDYVFTKLDAPTEAKLEKHESLFLAGLFGNSSQVTLSSLREKFYTHLPEIRGSIYQSLTDKKLFNENPDKVRGKFTGFGVFFIVLGVIAAVVGGKLGFVAFGYGLAISGLFVLLSAKAMPSKTALGSQRLRECLGFQRFVKLAEKDRIAVLAKDDPTIFGRLLPYAMVLGVADQWAYAFKDLMSEPPDWYSPYGYGHAYMFNSTAFVNDLGGGMNTMGNTFSSAPQSTGGGGGSGFSSGGGSGGGFGGGGGGSW